MATRWKTFLRGLAFAVAPLLFLVALWFLHGALKEHSYRQIVAQIESIPGQRFLLAALLAFGSYLALTMYDYLGLLYVGHRLPYARVAPISFISYAFNNNVSLGSLSGGAVRYRFYVAWGLSAQEVVQVLLSCVSTFWIGFITLGTLVFLFEPVPIDGFLGLPFHSTRPVGFLLGAVWLFFFGARLLRRSDVRLGNWKFTLPPWPLLLAQMAVSCLDWAMVGSILYVLLPGLQGLSLLQFLSLFLLAQLVGVLSTVPGGIGVFESTLLLLLTPYYSDTVAIAGALLTFRAVYYFAPLILSLVVFLVLELQLRLAVLKPAMGSLGGWVRSVAPNLVALAIFTGGAVLLISGSIPRSHLRMEWLSDIVPLPVMELSHFFGSLVGMALILLSRGLQRRVDAAWFLTSILLVVGTVLSVVKGLDYEEASILGMMAVALFLSRKAFYRRASLFDPRFTLPWVLAITLVVFTTLWLGLFSYKHVEYSSDLWWRFALHGDASRFLRASVGMVGLLGFFSAAKLLRPAKPALAPASSDQMDRAASIVAECGESGANIALLGDKSLLFSESGNAFIMYGIESRSWVSMGDPVGSEEERTELVWRFLEECDAHSGWPVFYQVPPDSLPLYIEAGLAPLKLGEVARVYLPEFSLEGRARRRLRHHVSHMEKRGCTFEVLPKEAVPALLPRLKEISDTWLETKNTREKRFSLGYFDADYLSRFPLAIARVHGEIVAFSNLWQGASRQEVSIDLMRHDETLKSGVMEYLLTSLMLWGKEQGYQWFDLGMAPLSGLESHALAPTWHRLGSFLFAHGEHFYSFKGLRAFKEKFGPVWTPCYLCSPAGLALPQILMQVAALVAGGYKGILSK